MVDLLDGGRKVIIGQGQSVEQTKEQQPETTEGKKEAYEAIKGKLALNVEGYSDQDISKKLAQEEAASDSNSDGDDDSSSGGSKDEEIGSSQSSGFDAHGPEPEPIKKEKESDGKGRRKGRSQGFRLDWGIGFSGQPDAGC